MQPCFFYLRCNVMDTFSTYLPFAINRDVIETVCTQFLFVYIKSILLIKPSYFTASYLNELYCDSRFTDATTSNNNQFISLCITQSIILSRHFYYSVLPQHTRNTIQHRHYYTTPSCYNNGRIHSLPYTDQLPLLKLLVAAVS